MIIIHRIAISLALAILGALVPVAPGGIDQTFSRTDAAERDPVTLPYPIGAD